MEYPEVALPITEDPPDVKPLLHPATTSPSASFPCLVVFRRQAPASDKSFHKKVGAAPPRSRFKVEKQEEEEKCTHKCSSCGKVFVKKWQLVVHVKTHDQEKPKVAARVYIRGKRSILDELDQQATEHRCVCGGIFPSKWLLSEHMKTHTDEKPQRAECKICKKTFQKRDYLAVHIRTHTGERPYKCETCGKSFTHSSSFLKHKRGHNGIREVKKQIVKPKIHRCEICNKSYSRATRLIDHLNFHTGEERHKCNICGKSYRFSGSLIQHRKRSHSGNNSGDAESQKPNQKRRRRVQDRPYRCEICMNRFRHPETLAKHKEGHVGETKRQYKCDTCNKIFSYFYTMMKHIKLQHIGERPHFCEICNKTFSQKCHLIKHRRTHTGEKPYACDICDKSFAASSTLYRHLKIHTGERPYSCEICSKKFITKYNLDCHKQMQHGKEEGKEDEASAEA